MLGKKQREEQDIGKKTRDFYNSFFSCYEKKLLTGAESLELVNLVWNHKTGNLLLVGKRMFGNQTPLAIAANPSMMTFEEMKRAVMFADAILSHVSFFQINDRWLCDFEKMEFMQESNNRIVRAILRFTRNDMASFSVAIIMKDMAIGIDEIFNSQWFQEISTDLDSLVEHIGKQKAFNHPDEENSLKVDIVVSRYEADHPDDFSKKLADER